MVGWEPCSTEKDRSCWLQVPGNYPNDPPKKKLDIHQNYENVEPVGVNRYYELDIFDDTVINADGVDFPYAKTFNRQYPGPWLQACWGDVRILI